MAQQFDLVVIGMGSAGTMAARFAADELGLRVAAVERERVGGDCLWTGCVPSKSLLASARAVHAVTHAEEHGVTVGEIEVDLAAVWQRIRGVQQSIATTDDNPDRYRQLGIDLVEGTARITGAREVTVDTAEGVRTLTTRYILVCTGSRPTVPPIIGLDEVDYLTTDRLFELERPPASIVIVGAGPVSAEIAQALVRLGIDTTVIGSRARLLTNEEPELSDRLTSRLRDEGVVLHLGSRVTEVRRAGEGVVVRAGDVEAAAVAVLLAAGRTADVAGLGLETFGIRTGPTGITVDARSRTIVPSIYAVGDAAADRPTFTHTAAYDAAMAVRDMFFPGRRQAARLVPWCTFTDPELAHVGMTAAEARERYGSRNVEVHRHEFADSDRARADGRTEGALLLVTAKRRVIGAHALGPTAGEMIHELALAVHLGLKLGELAKVVHVYPTYATGIAQLTADSSFRTGRRFRAVARLSRWLG